MTAPRKTKATAIGRPSVQLRLSLGRVEAAKFDREMVEWFVAGVIEPGRRELPPMGRNDSLVS